MYSLDINFLKDRPEYKSETGTRSLKSGLPSGKWTRLYLGLAAGLLLPTIVGAGWLYLQNQNTQLEQKIAAIDGQLKRLGIQEQEIKKIQQDTSQINGQTQSLASVFNQVRPVSAMLQDIRDRIPKTVQIENIKQIAAQAAPQQSASPAPNSSAPQAASQQGASPAPSSAGGIEISGIALSFNDVNDFLLTLQQSPLFKPTETKILTAELVDSPIAAASSASVSTTGVSVKLPQVVRYTIQSSLSDAHASDLLRELERKGTLGLVTRIRTLQQTGVIPR